MVKASFGDKTPNAIKNDTVTLDHHCSLNSTSWVVCKTIWLSIEQWKQECTVEFVF
jgi:hypothetical protein